MIDCMDLMEESWNKWGSVRIEYIIGTGPMRDKQGNILPESWLGDYEVHKFQVGVRPPIYCIWDVRISLSQSMGEGGARRHLPKIILDNFGTKMLQFCYKMIFFILTFYNLS